MWMMLAIARFLKSCIGLGRTQIFEFGSVLNLIAILRKHGANLALLDSYFNLKNQQYRLFHDPIAVHMITRKNQQISSPGGRIAIDSHSFCFSQIRRQVFLPSRYPSSCSGL